MKLAYAFRNTVFYPYHGGGLVLPPGNLRGKYLAKVRQLGFDGIELRLDSLGGVDASEKELRELRSVLEDAGLPCIAIRGGGGLHVSRVAAQNRKLLEKGVQVADWLGAGILNSTMTTHLVQSRPRDNRGEPVSLGSSRMASEADFAAAARGFVEIADLAAGVGVAIAIELHHNSIVDNSWSALHVLELIDRPNVGINADVKNMYWTYDIPEETCEEAFLALAPHANYFHCKNITRIPLLKEDYTLFIRHVLSHGEINYRFAIAALLDAGYDGYLAIEGTQTGDQLYIDGQSAAYARELIREWEADRK